MSFWNRLFRRRQSRVVEPERPIRARYDAAQDTNEIVNLWANADALDADASNSLAVRQKLRKRARYERANNGHCSGILRTQANYVIGTGPTLRMQTGNAAFNQMVEARWRAWCAASGFVRKLRTMCRAKVGDGEAFAIIHTNPDLNDPVKIDLRLVECDQVTSPTGKSDKPNYIDGITFDVFGNPVSYDVLRRHPGATWWGAGADGYDSYPAAFVCHWFGGDERPGQHRGVPELTPSLNLFGTGRRYREAVVAAAETAADHALMVEMGAPNQEPDEVAPFSTFPIDKRMMTILPAGAKAAQLKAEQPSTTHDSFVRSMVCEEARPLNMPYNIAACDSSDYSYSGGQLDHQTYFVSIDVERQDCEYVVLDLVFAAWFREATDVFGWTGDGTAPLHGWNWKGRPHSDPTKIADARKTRLSCGDVALSELAAEDGVDFEDRIAVMATDYGVSEDEIRRKLFESNFQKSGGAPSQPGDESGEKPVNRIARYSSNGNGKARAGT